MEGLSKKEKRTQGPGQQCGDCREDQSIRGLSGNEKNTTIFFL